MSLDTVLGDSKTAIKHESDKESNILRFIYLHSFPNLFDSLVNSLSLFIRTNAVALQDRYLTFATNQFDYLYGRLTNYWSFI
jgi:hypothetical protein